MKRVSVAGKVIAITGGARGIGLATPTVLQDLGATAAIGDVDRSAVKDAGSQLGLKDFLDHVEDQLGPVDVLVNNAGVIAAGSAVDEADAITKRVLGVNIYGVILGTKLAARRMSPRVLNRRVAPDRCSSEGTSHFVAALWHTRTHVRWCVGDPALAGVDCPARGVL
jgi:NAD(P)-dependent dehydrogenase (short-subunit alcohol dehydrogenase family)